jgi:hypothetical protein
MSKFRSIERKQSKLSCAILGVSGSGKSGLALLMATNLASNPDKVYAADTENGSLDLFEGITMSDGKVMSGVKVTDLAEDYGSNAPTNYIAARNDAIAEGCEVFISDSITHGWLWILDRVSAINEEANTTTKNVSAWNKPEIVTNKNILRNEIFRSSDVHNIVTIRQKEKIAITQEEGQKAEVIKLGEQPIMMDDCKFEPDLVLTMVKAGTPDGVAPVARVDKTRYAMLRLGQEYTFTPELIKQFADYLNEGVSPEVLLERQKNDLITSIKDMVGNDNLKGMKVKMFKTTNKLDKDMKLDEMSIDQLRSLYDLIFE